MGKTVAITGVTSYFAQTLLPLLQQDPQVEKIIGIGRRPCSFKYNKVEYHREDIRSKAMVDLLKGVDTVYHLAYIVGEIHDKKKTDDININGSKNVFTACVKNNVRKVIYTSSMTAYGAHADNPIGFTEDHPLAGNQDSYYAASKVKVETFVTDFFKDYPETILTVLRTSLLVGPNMNNFFSKLYSLPVLALSMGKSPYMHFIHEDDLGTALHLAFEKDIPGTYNVGADDAVPSRWAFKTAGVKTFSLPSPVLKTVMNVAFGLHLLPASQGWVSLSEYTIFGRSDKFKQATGWQPEFTSKQAFLSWVNSRKNNNGHARQTPTQHFLNWLYKRGDLMKPNMKILDVNFMMGKIPVLNKKHPWMDPQKNSMSYLPINQNLKVDKDTVLPPQVLHDLIDKASVHVIMNTCGCRLAKKCEHFTEEIGCLFMGDTALKLPAKISRKVTRQEAHDHVERAMEHGLVPMTGKVRVDNFIFLTSDQRKLLSVCFCCHCCCMMGYMKHMDPAHLDEVMVPLEGVKVWVDTKKCKGCGTCVEYCIFEAISIKDGKAVHSDKCRACGRCERYCPNQAVKIKMTDPKFKEQAEERICSYVDI